MIWPKKQVLSRYQAADRLTSYEAELARARQDAGESREEGRAAGAVEQQKLVGEAQQSARNILAETRASLQTQAAETLETLRKQAGEFSSRLADRLIKGLASGADSGVCGPFRNAARCGHHWELFSNRYIIEQRGWALSRWKHAGFILPLVIAFAALVVIPAGHGF